MWQSSFAMLVTASVIVGQTPALDPISGGAGWVGAGILGLVLGWLLLIHLPAKDKLLVSLVEQKDSAVNALMHQKEQSTKDLMEQQIKEREIERAARHAVASEFQKIIVDQDQKHNVEQKLAREDFKNALNMVMAHCEKQSEKLLEAFRNEVARIAEKYERISKASA